MQLDRDGYILSFLEHTSRHQRHGRNRTGETRQDADKLDMPADAARADRLRQLVRTAHFDDMINAASVGPA